jgi:hypothetical protein
MAQRMAGVGNKKMKQGAILFAFNTEKYDYYTMAVAAAKRINHFLDLPVTVVTDESSIQETDYSFDKTIITTSDKTNKRDFGIWINKGRFRAFEFSPYEETLLLDTDYMVNSNKLLKTFEFPTDICCHDHAEFFMQPNIPQEILSPFSFETLWATAVMFKRSKKAQQVFETIKLIQHNYEHYANIHGFLSMPYRNDFALTLALRIVNGHVLPKENIIPWSLMHIGNNTPIVKNSTDFLDTEFTIQYDNWQRGKIRKDYITIKDMDFHCIVKENFMELIK